MIILKVTENQGLTFSLEDTLFEKPQGEGKVDPPSRFRVNHVQEVKRNQSWIKVFFCIRGFSFTYNII